MVTDDATAPGRPRDRETFPMNGLRFVVLAVLVGMLAACAAHGTSTLSPPPTTTKEERRGDELFKAGQFPQAMQEYDNAAAKGAAKASVAYRKGYVFFLQGNWREALMLFAEALGNAPDLAIATEGAGLAAFQLGMYFDAKNYFEKTVALAPKHWVPYAFLAAMFQAAGDPRDSEFATKAIALAGAEQRPLAEQTILDAGQRLKAFANQTRKPAEVRPMMQGGTEEEVVEVKVSKEGFQERVLSSQKFDAPQPAAPAPGQDAGPVPFDPANPALLPKASAHPARPASAPLPTLSGGAPTPSATQRPTAQAPRATPAPGDGGQTTSAGQAGAAAGQGPFVIIESSFKTASEAQTRLRQLQAKGFQASALRVDLGARGIWHRVVFGPFQNADEAKAERTRLSSGLGSKGLVIIRAQ